MRPILEHLRDIIAPEQEAINTWFNERYSKADPFFYSSVDLRHSGHKIVPVDTNLFPAGFNLLSEEAIARGVEQTKQYFKKYFPDATSIAIIPENHTRNLYYLENVLRIQQLLESAGLKCIVGGLEITETTTLETASGQSLAIAPLNLSNNQLQVGDQIPNIILMNNDLSAGVPDILHNLSQPIIPPLGMGWYRRRKTRHFDTYAEVARIFAKKFNFDPWLISASFTKCGTINFKERKGLECVAKGVERCLNRIKKKYKEYGIVDEPYVFIKADSGTYGMGIMTVKSPEEVLEINKKSRNKMNIIKEGTLNSEVIIQEGIPTIDTIEGKVAEPLMYLINGEVIGCTYRVNEQRDAYSNLNAQGMTFKTACEGDAEATMDSNNLCPVQSLISRLASLAATYECYEEQWDI